MGTQVTLLECLVKLLQWLLGDPKPHGGRRRASRLLVKVPTMLLEIAFAISLRKRDLRVLSFKFVIKLNVLSLAFAHDLSIKFGALRSCHRDLSIKQR